MRWRVADNQTQRTLGGNIMEVHETGPYVLWHDYARLQYKSQCQTEGIDAFDKKLREAEAEVERLTQLNSTLALRYDATNSMLDGCAKEIEEMEAQVERLTYVDDFIVITKPSIKQLIEQGAQNTPGRYDEQYLIQVDRECYLKVLKHMAEFWEKAKEGKQS
jgi:hypothetical protein